MDWILDNDNRLNGARVATTRIRPLRLAYIVPDDDPKIVRRVIHSCCLTWGGAINPLIPYSRAKGFSPTWVEILRKFDPDNLVDCVGISDADKEQFADRRQYIHRWEKPLETFFMVGALQYSAMNAFAKGVKDDKSQITIQPKLEPDDKGLYLPLIAKYGELDEQFLDETMKLHGVKRKIKYADFANISETDFSTEIDGIFLGTTPSSVTEGRSGVFHFHHLLSLTKLGLNIRGAPYGASTPEEPQDEEAFGNNIIVTGKSNCVSDLCLYWDLRIERPFTVFLPLWIPLDFLVSEDGLRIVNVALQWADTKQKGFGINPSVYVLSTSINEKKLEDKLKSKLEDVKCETEALHRFISGKWNYYHLEEDREVHFDSGSVRVPVPNCESLKQFAPEDRVVHEITFPGIRLPLSKSLKDNIWGSLLRQTRQGFEGFSYVSSWPDIVSVGIPSHWTILESVFRDAGYDCRPSDKSVFALGLLRLFGSIEDLGTIASTRVYQILKDMCRIKGQQRKPREFYAEREEFDYSRLKQSLGQQSEVILNWLIKKGVVFRGARIRCPKCQLSKWYELDRINKTWHCDGCLSDLATPLDLDQVRWNYRINELYARGHDQGIITHLLSIYALHPPAVLGDTAILGYYPGIKITTTSPEVAERTKIEEMEIDLVAIRDGRLLIAECKDTGAKLTKKEVNRYVRLANHIKCSRILFVTPTAFPQADALFDIAQKKCKALVEWWEGSDILDVSVSERMGGQRETNISDEQRSLEYLSKLAGRLDA